MTVPISVGLVVGGVENGLAGVALLEELGGGGPAEPTQVALVVTG